MTDVLATRRQDQLGELAELEATDRLLVGRGEGPVQVASAEAMMDFMEANGVGAANAAAAAASAETAVEAKDEAVSVVAGLTERWSLRARMPDQQTSLGFAGRDAGGKLRKFGRIDVAGRLDMAQTRFDMPGFKLEPRLRLAPFDGRIPVLTADGRRYGWLDPRAGEDVGQARGTRDSLAARLGQSLDAHGNLIDGFGGNRLRNWHMKRRRRLRGLPDRNVVAVFGTSYEFLRTRWTEGFAHFHIAEQGDGGGGWTGFGFNAPNAPPYSGLADQPGDVNANVRDVWGGVVFEGAWTSAYASVPSPDLCCAISSSAGATIYALLPNAAAINGADLYWIGTADGVIDYAWGTWNNTDISLNPATYDFGAETSLNLQGGAGVCNKASLAGAPPLGPKMLRIRRSAGTIKPAGVDWRNTAAPGVVVNKLAATGSRLQQLATQSATASWKARIADLGISTAFLSYGPNDQSAGRTPAQFAADAATVIDNLRLAIPGVDVCFFMPPENQMNYPVRMKDLCSALAAVCAAKGVAFRNWQGSFGSADDPDEYGPTGPVPLMNADRLHPEVGTGGERILDDAIAFTTSY